MNRSHRSEGREAHIFRNTFIGGRLFYRAIQSGWPELPFHRNIVFNEDEGVDCSDSCSAPERIVETENLVFGMDRADAVSEDFTISEELEGYEGSQGHALVAE